MSAYFSGVTFVDQPVTPSDDALIHRAMLPDGILAGCSFSHSGNTLTMDTGTLLICGRQVRHVSAQNWTIDGAKDGFARLVITVDVTRTATKDSFDQVVPSIEYAADINGFTPLEAGDINASGIRYQMAACVVSLGSSGITGIVQTPQRFAPGLSYAPAGFGLGMVEGHPVTSLEALDELSKSGWYQLAVTSGDAYISGVNANRAVVQVSSFDERYGRQDITVAGGTFCIQRFKTQGLWGPWEFVNPPMVAGMEYCTTEHWNGAHVYTKLIAFDPELFTGQNIALAHGIDNLDICVSAKAIWKRTDSAPDGWRQLPAAYYATSDWDGQIDYVNAESVKFMLGYKLLASLRNSTEPMYVTLKYTKI